MSETYLQLHTIIAHKKTFVIYIDIPINNVYNRAVLKMI